MERVFAVHQEAACTPSPQGCTAVDAATCLLSIGVEHKLVGEFGRVAVRRGVVPSKHEVELTTRLDPLRHRSFELLPLLVRAVPASFAFRRTAIAGAKTADGWLVALGILAEKVRLRIR